MASSISSSKDSRKFVNDTGSNNFIVLGTEDSQNNFKSFEAVFSWLKYNSHNSATVILRGNILIEDALSIGDLDNFVLFKGDGARLTIQAALTIKSNIIFENVNFDLEMDSAITINLSSNVKFINCTFNGNASVFKALTLSISSNIEIIGCIFNCTSVITPTNLVNSAEAFIYASVPSLSIIRNIKIKDNIFNYLPTVAGNSRAPFISFEFASNTAVISDLTISGNNFYNVGATSSSAGSIKDYRAVIAIVNTYIGSGGTKNPTLINTHITNNSCDNRQLCIITSTTNGSPAIMDKYLINCKNVHINDNMFGAIGFYTTSTTNNNANNPVATTLYLNDKQSGLEISGNTCQLIATMDQAGAYFSNYAADPSNTAGFTIRDVVIKNNRVSHIHVGSGEVNINNNIILANDTSALLTIFSDTLDSAIDIRGGGANGLDPFTFCTVYGNLISYSGADSSYTYAGTVINVLINCNIYDNRIIVISSSAGTGINVGGYYNNIYDNQIIRFSGTFSAYIKFSHPTVLPSSSTGIVINNFFNSSTVDGSNEVLDGGTIPSTWMYEKNKNQIKIMSFGLMEGIASFDATSAITPPAYFTGTGGLVIKPVSATGYSFPPATDSIGSVLSISDTSLTSTNVRSFSKSISLSGRLPSDVTVLSAKIGIFVESGSLFDSTEAGVGSVFDLSIVKELATTSATYATGVGSILDVKNSPTGVATGPTTSIVSGQLFVNSDLKDANIKTDTQYVEAPITPPASGFYTDKNQNISVVFNAVFTNEEATNPLLFKISPIVVKYKF